MKLRRMIVRLKFFPVALLVLSFLQAHGTTSVGCPRMSVRSLDRSIAFYASVLQFTAGKIKDSTEEVRLEPDVPATAVARTARLALGDECVDLTEYDLPQGRPFPADSEGNDHWFQHIAIVVSDMGQAYARLRAAGIQSVSNVPQELPASNKSAAGISAFYFRDIDGHYLELIHFPFGKGQSKWQDPSSKLFLGIDHTAIVVTDTQRSLRFYRDFLRLRVVGGSENVGVEQEHLSRVFNAHVLITSLRADAGPGVELLEYITPQSGRAIPSEQRPADVASWQIPIWTAPIGSANAMDSQRISGWHRLPTGVSEAAWIKDPDNHIVEVLR